MLCALVILNRRAVNRSEQTDAKLFAERALLEEK
jgi:hypothetical protein